MSIIISYFNYFKFNIYNLHSLHYAGYCVLLPYSALPYLPTYRSRVEMLIVDDGNSVLFYISWFSKTETRTEFAAFNPTFRSIGGGMVLSSMPLIIARASVNVGFLISLIKGQVWMTSILLSTLTRKSKHFAPRLKIENNCATGRIPLYCRLFETS